MENPDLNRLKVVLADKERTNRWLAEQPGKALTTISNYRMAVSDDRKFTSAFVCQLLEGIKGKTLGEVDKSHQFARTEKSEKITGIAGDVIEQSVFGYERDSKQECDIEIDGVLTELKTTGVRVPKSDLKHVKNKVGAAYNVFLGAKEGISITGVTFEPTIQTEFQTSHFWEKSEHLLIVFYEYKSYDVVPADRDIDFEESEVYNYFCEHSFLCPIFCEYDSSDSNKTVFKGFKRFSFDDKFIEDEVRRTWENSRKLIHRDELEWEYVYDPQGNKRMNKSGAYMGAPNFPKSSEYIVFFRGGADISTEKTRTECVNGIRMLPQFFWLKGSYIANKLQEIPYI